MVRTRILAALLICGIPGTAAYAQDPVSDWNAIAVQYIQIGNTAVTPPVPGGRPGPAGLLDLAILHAAVHDAVQAIEGRFEPFHYADPTRRGVGSPAAAVAGAARRMLLLLYPQHQAAVEGEYALYLSAHGLAGDPGLDTGDAAAAAVHAAHYRPTVPFEFTGRAGIGQWNSTRNMAAAFLVLTRPFTFDRASQFRPEPPPPIVSEIYRRDYDEVRARASVNSHPNAATDMTKFWSSSFNYFTQLDEALRRIAAPRLGVGDSARLFALASLARADAIIAIWDSKHHYNFWRPSAAIPAGDEDGNGKTAGDLSWLPFFTTLGQAEPPYPDYVSGANGLVAALTGTLRLFFDSDELAFSVRNPADSTLADQERYFTRISDVERELVEARLLLGLHFRTADEEGRRLGLRIAGWTFKKVLGPVRGTQR